MSQPCHSYKFFGQIKLRRHRRYYFASTVSIQKCPWLSQIELNIAPKPNNLLPDPFINLLKSCLNWA